jgi:hypothetical protein
MVALARRAAMAARAATAVTRAPLTAASVSPNSSLARRRLTEYDQQPHHTHCKGTNHQSIQGIKKVVFLGDSITVGTPPTNVDPAAVYRAILAKKLATLLGVTPPGPLWGAADPFSGTALPKESGDFVSCAKWGARTDDLMQDSTQVEDCIPVANRNLRQP